MSPGNSIDYSAGSATLPAGRRQTGFTLIELMVVVAVIAILASIAYPSYTDSVRKSRRGQAKADMVELAQMLERRHTEANSYVGFAAPFNQSPRSGEARYTIAIGNLAANTFTITATPQTGQDKDKCGTMSLNQAGQKTPADPVCWQ